MNDFAHLLDRLAYEPRRNAKLRLLQDYFAHAPDPERGWALAAMTGNLSFREAKPAMIRGLVEARVDPVLFALSHNYVGDLAETTALIWPSQNPPPSAGEGGPRVSEGRRGERHLRKGRPLSRLLRRHPPPQRGEGMQQRPVRATTTRRRTSRPSRKWSRPSPP